jgi:hypothetical protein
LWTTRLLLELSLLKDEMTPTKRCKLHLLRHVALWLPSSLHQPTALKSEGGWAAKERLKTGMTPTKRYSLQFLG